MAASRRFRRIVKMRMLGNSEMLPMKSIELTSTYDLGGDGKQYWQGHDAKWMRK